MNRGGEYLIRLRRGRGEKGKARNWIIVKEGESESVKREEDEGVLTFIDTTHAHATFKSRD